MARDVNQVDTPTREPKPRPKPAPPRPTNPAPKPPAPVPPTPPGRPAPPKIRVPGRHEQLVRQAVDAYHANGGLLGPFGVPKGPVTTTNAEGRWQLSGGTIVTRPDGSTDAVISTVMKVEYVGIHCWSEAKRDQGSDSDEPFVIASLVRGGAAVTHRFGPYSDVDSGEERVEPRDMVSDWSPLPTHLHVVVMEHDEGSLGEARRKVANSMNDAAAAASQIAQAVNVSQVAAGGNATPLWLDVATGLLSGPAGVLLTRGITGLLDLGDDQVGIGGVTLFRETDPFTTPPMVGNLGGEPYTHKVFIDGGGAGKYDVFFRVQLLDIHRNTPHV